MVRRQAYRHLGPVSAPVTETAFEAPSVLEVRCSRQNFLIVVTDGMRHAIRGREGALQVADSEALAGAITRTGGGAGIAIGLLPPQATRIVVYLAAGPAAELDVLSDGVIRARHVVAGGEAREALVLRRRGSSWNLRAPATPISDLAQHLAGVGVPLGVASPERPPLPAPRAPVPSPHPQDPAPAAGAAVPTEAVPTEGTASRHSGRRMLVAGAVLVAIAASAGAFVLSRADDPAPVPPSGGGGGQAAGGQAAGGRGAGGTTRSPPTPKEEQQAREVKAALVRLPDDPAALLSADTADQTAASARAAVPEGTTVTVDERTWAPDGLGGGAVRVTLRSPSGQQTPYVAVMVQEDGKWKVLSTVPVTQ